MSSEPDTPTETDTDRLYHQTEGDRTITAEAVPHDLVNLRGSSFETIRLQVTEGDEEGTIELTRRQLADLSRAVGNQPRRPPRRDYPRTLESHFEVADFGDSMYVDTPYARFHIWHCDVLEGQPWLLEEVDADVRMTLETAPTRNAAVVALFARLGMLWNVAGYDDGR